MSHHNRTVGLRLVNRRDRNRVIPLRIYSSIFKNNWTPAYVITRTQNGMVKFNNNKILYKYDKKINLMVLISFPTFRFMKMMRDCWAVPMCGLFLILLSAMCVAAFSAITVKYCIHFSHTKTIVTIVLTCRENNPQYGVQTSWTCF
jgi:hypothetical protein